MVARDVGYVPVTANVQDIEWKHALDAVMRAQGLIVREDTSGIIHIEKEQPAPVKITASWQRTPLADVVEAFVKLSGRTIVIARDVGPLEVTANVENIEWKNALDAIMEANGLVVRVDAADIIHIERPTPVRWDRDATSRRCFCGRCG